jgi:hypothetical protein
MAVSAAIALPAGFLELPDLIYAEDPHWIPESGAETAALLSSTNRRLGGCQPFCVSGQTRAVGFRPDGLEVEGEPAALFGYYESVGNAVAEETVIEGIRMWARRQGARRLFGPINLTTALPHGVRFGGPSGAFLDEPYNPPTYPRQLEALGLELAHRYVSYDMDASDVAALAEGGRGARALLIEDGFTFAPLTPATWIAHADGLFEVGSAVFAGSFDVEPLSREEFALRFDERWAERLHPELSVIAFDPAGAVAGIGLVYPHYAPLAAQGAGKRRVAVPRLTYQQHGSGLSEVVFKAGGVGHTHRGIGLAHAIACDVASRAIKTGITRMMTGLIGEDGPGRRILGYGHRDERRYGLYSQSLE